MINQTKPTAEKPLLFIGLDVHKESIAVAIAEEGRQGAVRAFGSISGDLHAVEKLLAKIRKVPGIDHGQLRVIYEAGPCGYVIARRLRQLGVDGIARPPANLPSPFRHLGCGPVVDPQKVGRSSQDGPTRCGETRATAPIRRPGSHQYSRCRR
jgi:hypothetical protein